MFFFLLFLSWTLQAVFCGFALAFAVKGKGTMAQRLIPALAADFSLACIALFLIDQQFFSSLGLNLSLSVIELTLLFASLCLYWQGCGTLHTLFRIVNLSTFLTSLIWFTGSPSSFFLAVLFFPNDQIFEYHAGGVAVFGIILLGTALAVSTALARSKLKATSPATSRPRRFSYFILGLLGCGLLLAVYFSPALQTIFILKKRDHTMQLFGVMRDLAIEIRQTDMERSLDGQSSIYPADVKYKTAHEYLNFLYSNGFAKQPPNLDWSEVNIGNVSRADSDQTIFLRSNQTQYDIHTMIHNIGGVPNYAHGFLLLDKDGKGQFYREERRGSSQLGIEPPRDPSYLPH